MDLILHIGFPKTGTTTLQKNVFRHVPGYIRHIDGSYGKMHAADHLRTIIQRPNPKCDHDGYIKNWCKDIYSEAKKHGLSRVLLSAEGISSLRIRETKYLGAIKWDPDTVAERIAQLQNFWSDYGELYILMTIRNQPELLASHYSQHSDRYLQASTKHFEAFLWELLEQAPENVEWNSWMRRMADVVGLNRVLTLPMEGMREDKYWQDLGKFCGVSFDNGIVQDHGHANKKRLEGGMRWRVRSFNYRRRKLEERKWCQLDQPLAYKLNQRVTFLLAIPVNFGVAVASPLLRNNNIELREEIRHELLERFRSSNLELGETIGWDLEALGYG